MRLLIPLALLAGGSPAPLPLFAQQWNTPATEALVARAVARRSELRADSALQRYRSRARGTVLFLAQVGSDSRASPRLLRADRLDVEVYWQAPRLSKQIIRQWGQRTYFPTDLQYHRDHLGIVTDDFGDAIHLGEGDEVRDVVHPLSIDGQLWYDYRQTDSIALRGGGLETVVHVVQVRPRDPGSAGVAGTLYLDGETAALVRFRFSFTAAAYLQSNLERIIVDLEAALFDQRFWVPFRQRIEVHRRTGWLDFPLRTIIRGVWDIGDYEFDPSFSAAVFAGGPYGGLRQPVGSWSAPIHSSVPEVVIGTGLDESENLLQEARQLFQEGFVATPPRPPVRLAFGGLSDLVRVNRVQGLVLGLGWSLRPRGWPLRVLPWFQYGFADGRPTGGARFSMASTSRSVALEVSRRIEDVGDWPVISPVLNSFLAQERGQDFGDYILLDRVRVLGRLRVRQSWNFTFEVGWERSENLSTTAVPASGSYRPNPQLAGGSIGVARIGVRRSSGDPLTDGWDVHAASEGGVGGSDYLRFTWEGAVGVPLAVGHLLVSVRGGTTLGNSPAHRAFLLGGRGTLVGEEFRAFGGTSMAWTRMEWRIPVVFPALGPGSVVRDRGTIALFLSAGWAAGAPGLQDRDGRAGVGAGGVRPVVGVATDLLFQTLRIELVWAPRARRVGLVLDATPVWWPIL